MKLFTWFGRFIATMEGALLTKKRIGWRGWDTMNVHTLKTRLLKNVEEGDWIDVANYAFFLWERKAKIGKESDREAKMTGKLRIEDEKNETQAP